MMYLREYCNQFNLNIDNNLIVDSKLDVVGYIETNKKYVKFKNQKSPIKISDLLLLTFENLCVH